MKLLCGQEELIKALHLGTKALAVKSTLPILSGLLLETRKNSLYCASTDLEIGIEVEIPEVSINEPGRVVVPGKLFYEIIRHLSPGRVEMGLDEEKKVFVIKGEQFLFTLHTMPVDEYPLLPEGFRAVEKLNGGETGDEDTLVFFLPVQAFREAVKYTIFATLPEDPRPFLSSVLAEFTPNTLRLVGTDINRLVLKEINIDGQKEFSTLIPVNSLREMANVLGNTTDEQFTFKMVFYKKLLYVVGEGVVFSTRLVDAQYPRYQQVIPEEFHGTVQLKREPFLNALERISLVDRAVKLSLVPGKGMHISAQEPELGTAYEEVDCLYEGEEIEVGFNALFLLNFLKVIHEEEIVFKVTAGMKASVLKPSGDEQYTYVIMPLRMNT